MLGGHHVDIGAELPPEIGQPRHRVGVGARRRREDAPAVLEEVGQAGVGPGIFRAGDGMRRHEMNLLRQMRGHLGDHRGLDRADIRDDGARFQRRGDRRGNLARGADGHAQDDAIGVADRLGRVGVIAVAKPELLGALQRLAGPAVDGDLADGAGLARGEGDRRADQADADQCQLLEKRFGHHAAFALARKSRSADRAASLASTEPMVMRKAFGR